MGSNKLLLNLSFWANEDKIWRFVAQDLPSARQRRAYVKVADLEQVWAAVDLWHRLHPPIWPIRKLLAELRQTNQTLEV